jgi:hypothetical protein
MPIGDGELPGGFEPPIETQAAPANNQAPTGDEGQKASFDSSTIDSKGVTDKNATPKSKRSKGKSKKS